MTRLAREVTAWAALAISATALFMAILAGHRQAVESQKQRAAICQAVNDNRTALTRVLRESIEAREEVGLPGLEEFSTRYETIIAVYLRPLDCRRP